MTVSDLKVGQRLIFGGYSSYPDGQNRPISWLKATKENVFFSEFVLDVLPFDSVEMRRGLNGYNTYCYNNEYNVSNICQFLNADGYNWYVPSHENDTIAASFRRKPGFLTDFETDELNVVQGGFQLPEIEDIFGVRAFNLFKRKGIRGRPSHELVESGYSSSGFMAYMTQSKASAERILCVGRSGLEEPYFANSETGIRPKCVIKADTQIVQTKDGNGFLLDFSATSKREDCTMEDIKSFLGIL